MQKVFFASDHAGFALKNELLEYVRGLGYEVEDCGAYEYDEDDDYPDFVHKAARKVSEGWARGQSPRAIVLGGSGQGEAMVANRHAHVRAAVWYGGALDIVTLSRTHNDANILSLGARFLSDVEAKDAVRIWLETDFSGDERHVRRIRKLNDFHM